MKASPMSQGFLSGITVLDLANETASFCSRLLADFGARVIKIEKPGGCSSRAIGPFLDDVPHPERSLSFFYANLGKQGITLDIEEAEGKSLFLELIKKADVVVETYPPGFLESLGLGFQILSQKKPGLILASVTGFGQTGLKKDHKSCDIVASACGGQAYISGAVSTPPLKPFGEQPYFSASLFAAVGILLALRRRSQTGKGEHIDISLQEAVTATLEHVMVRFFYENIISGRQGSHTQSNDFCILPCKDGFIQMSLFQQWETLVEWMAGSGMAGDLMDEKYREENFRQSHRDHIAGVVGAWTKTYTVNALFELSQLMRFPWAPVHSPKEVCDSPHLKARNFFKEVHHPELDRTLPYPGVPYRFSDLALPVPKRAPLTGEDNLQIYIEELALSREAFEAFKAKGVV